MIDVVVTVRCDVVPSGEDYCEAEFEVLRTEIPADLRDQVDRQLRLRGWAGISQGHVECPLHRLRSDQTEEGDDG